MWKGTKKVIQISQSLMARRYGFLHVSTGRFPRYVLPRIRCFCYEKLSYKHGVISMIYLLYLIANGGLTLENVEDYVLSLASSKSESQEL